MSIPTDCRVRDERTPCSMDSLGYEDAALCNFWMNRFYTKWLGDIQGGRGNPDWNGDMVFLPWRLYRDYGDVRILEENYANMQAYVEAIHGRTPGHMYTNGFGDWTATNPKRGLFRFLSCRHRSEHMPLRRTYKNSWRNCRGSRQVQRCGSSYQELSKKIVYAFNEKRFNAETSSYGDGSQTTAILPLALNLVSARQTCRRI